MTGDVCLACYSAFIIENYAIANKFVSPLYQSIRHVCTSSLPTPGDPTSNSCTRIGNGNLLKFYLTNARSLNNKMVDLHNLLRSENYDFIMVTETWLRSVTNDGYLIGGEPYHVFRCDRSDGFGGVAVFYKNSINVNKVDIHVVPGIDMICMEFTIKRDLKYRFVLVYNPPNGTVDTAKKIKETFRKILECNCPTVICGDFNFPRIDWTIPRSVGDAAHDIFVVSILENNLFQHVLEPTRNCSTLDLVFSNCPHLVVNCKVIEPLCVSCDHSSIRFNVFVPTIIKPVNSRLPHVVYDYVRGDYVGMQQFLASFDWSTLLWDSGDIQTMWSRFSNVMTEAKSLFIPTYRPTSNKPRHSKKIRKLLAMKRRW